MVKLELIYLYDFLDQVFYFCMFLSLFNSDIDGIQLSHGGVLSGRLRVHVAASAAARGRWSTQRLTIASQILHGRVLQIVATARILHLLHLRRRCRRIHAELMCVRVRLWHAASDATTVGVFVHECGRVRARSAAHQ